MAKRTGTNRGSTAEFDEMIKDECREFGVPVDQILKDPDLESEFHERVNGKLPPDKKVERTGLNGRLMTLRKRGQDKGGLPRLKCEYNGRKVKPR